MKVGNWVRGQRSKVRNVQETWVGPKGSSINPVGGLPSTTREREILLVKLHDV